MHGPREYAAARELRLPERTGLFLGSMGSKSRNAVCRRSTINGPMIALLALATASMQAATCQAFLTPFGVSTVQHRVSSFSRPGVERQEKGGHLAASRKERKQQIRGFKIDVDHPRGGDMSMVAGLPAAFSTVVNPAVVKASVRAVSELLCCCVLGVVAAKNGVLTPVNVGALSKIVYGIFLPALLMVNVAKTCVSQPVASLLPIPVFAAVQVGVGLFVSGVAMRVLNIDPNTETGRKAKVCGSFQNSGILPLIFINAMFRGNPELLSRGVAYVSFYLMGWSPSFWTIGNKILTGHVDEGKGEQEKTAADEISAQPKRKLTLVQRVRSIPFGVESFIGHLVAKKILSPPIVACIAGLVIGLSPPLRWLLVREGAPLGPMWAAFSNLTAAYTPAGVLVLAGSLANCPPGEWFSRDTQKTILAVGMARWLLLPLFTSGLLFAGVKRGLVPQDPMLLFVLLMESCMPSAQNSVIMLQVAGLQDAAGRCARTLCTIYLISIVPVSILLTLFISALKLV
ncbi:unnamed protein product [Scytosiphon promiscuus]